MTEVPMMCEGDKCPCQAQTDDEILDKIDAWHKGAGEGQELHEYLGMTWQEYTAWVVGRVKG